MTDKTQDKPLSHDLFGFGVTTAKHKAAALYCQDNGATTADVTRACGGPQLNLWRDLRDNGPHGVRQTTRPHPNGGKRTVKVYHIDIDPDAARKTADKRGVPVHALVATVAPHHKLAKPTSGKTN